MRVIGYMRVSTDEQGDSGAGIEAQEAVIRDEVARRGWELVDLRHDVASGKSLRKREALGETMRFANMVIEGFIGWIIRNGGPTFHEFPHCGGNRFLFLHCLYLCLVRLLG